MCLNKFKSFTIFLKDKTEFYSGFYNYFKIKLLLLRKFASFIKLTTMCPQITPIITDYNYKLIRDNLRNPWLK